LLREEKIQKARDNAAQNFRQGLNCSESVYLAVYDALDEPFLPRESVALVTGFGAGIGVYGSACGALLGGMAAIGLVHGRRDPLAGTPEERKELLYGNPGLYRFFNQLPNRFCSAFGEIDCAALTSDYHDDWLCKEHAKKCMKMIIETAGMSMELLLEGQERGYSYEYGDNVGSHQ